jgi:hypothetical protein
MTRTSPPGAEVTTLNTSTVLRGSTELNEASGTKHEMDATTGHCRLSLHYESLRVLTLTYVILWTLGTQPLTVCPQCTPAQRN